MLYDEVIGINRVTADPPRVDIKKYGYVVVVIEKVAVGVATEDHFRCSGLLVSRQLVFTTCSCIGTFRFFRGIYLQFDPISNEVFQVALGVDDIAKYVVASRKRHNDYPVNRIEAVLPHPKCSWDRVVGYKFNWGGIRMEEAVPILKPLALAPDLLNEVASGLEKITLWDIIKQRRCLVVGYGEVPRALRVEPPTPLRLLNVSFVTFSKCSLKICLGSTMTCLRHIDIADSGDMCLTSNNQSDNCFADVGSPLLCDGKLTGLTTFRPNCQGPWAPLLAARLEGAIDFYNSLRAAASGHSWTIITFILIVFHEFY